MDLSFEVVDMNKTILVAVAVIAAAALIFALTRPEPTPTERLSDAVQEAGDAAQDAVEELSTAVEDTVEAVQKEAETKAEEIQNSASEAMGSISAELEAASENTRKELDALIQDWKDTGIVTDAGIDFEAAINAVNELDIDVATKTGVNKILAFVRDLPGEAKAKLETLEKAL